MYRSGRRRCRWFGQNDRAEVWVQASLNTIVHDQIAGESIDVRLDIEVIAV